MDAIFGNEIKLLFVGHDAPSRSVVQEQAHRDKKEHQAAAEFLIFCAWLDWLAGVAPCPSRWPYSEYKREPVEKLLGRVKSDDPTTEPGPSAGEPA